MFTYKLKIVSAGVQKETVVKKKISTMQFSKNLVFTEQGWKLHIFPTQLHWCSLYSLIRAVGRSENPWGRCLVEVIKCGGDSLAPPLQLE